jgi:hypothetical protein
MGIIYKERVKKYYYRMDGDIESGEKRDKIIYIIGGNDMELFCYRDIYKELEKEVYGSCEQVLEDHEKAYRRKRQVNLENLGISEEYELVIKKLKEKSGTKDYIPKEGINFILNLSKYTSNDYEDRKKNKQSNDEIITYKEWKKLAIEFFSFMIPYTECKLNLDDIRNKLNWRFGLCDLDLQDENLIREEEEYCKNEIKKLGDKIFYLINQELNWWMEYDNGKMVNFDEVKNRISRQFAVLDTILEKLENAAYHTEKSSDKISSIDNIESYDADIQSYATDNRNCETESEWQMNSKRYFSVICNIPIEPTWKEKMEKLRRKYPTTHDDFEKYIYSCKVKREMIGKELMYGEAYLYWKEFGFYKQKIENELETKKLYSDATLVKADKLRKTLKEIEKYQDEISKEVSATYNQNRSEAEQMKNYGMIDTELLRLEIFEWRDLDCILKKFMEVWIL